MMIFQIKYKDNLKISNNKQRSKYIFIIDIYNKFKIYRTKLRLQIKTIQISNNKFHYNYKKMIVCNHKMHSYKNNYI